MCFNGSCSNGVPGMERTPDAVRIHSGCPLGKVCRRRSGQFTQVRIDRRVLHGRLKPLRERFTVKPLMAEPELGVY